MESWWSNGDREEIRRNQKNGEIWYLRDGNDGHGGVEIWFLLLRLIVVF